MVEGRVRIRRIVVPLILLAAVAVPAVWFPLTPANPQTNLVGNPGFEEDLSGWDSPEGIGLRRVGTAHSGDFAARVANTRSRKAACVLGDQPDWVAQTSSGTYRASAFVRAGDRGAVARIRLRELVGGEVVGAASSSTTLRRGWQRVAVSYATREPGSTLDLGILVKRAPRGACFLADQIALELGTAPPPVSGFPSRQEALDRPGVVDVPASLTDALEDDSPPANTTYDLRNTTSTAYPDATLYALNFGDGDPAAGLVTVGGAVLGKTDRSLTWQEIQDDFAGDAMRVVASDWTVAYDLRADNVQDGYNPRVQDGAQQDNDIPFLLEGAYMTYIRDDAVEDDDLMPGYIRDCLFDGVFVFLSAKPGSSDSNTNQGMVVTVEDVVVRMEAMPSEESPDGTGHNKIFKWEYKAAGSVVVRDSIFYLEEVPEGSTSNMRFPRGTYQNVTVILGADFDGDEDGNVTELDYPVPLPDGVTVTRDVSIFNRARNAWLDDHGFA